MITVTVSTKAVPPSFSFFLMQHMEILGLKWKAKGDCHMKYVNEQEGIEFQAIADGTNTKVILFTDSPPQEIPSYFQDIIEEYEKVLIQWTDNTANYRIDISYQLKYKSKV